PVGRAAARRLRDRLRADAPQPAARRRRRGRSVAAVRALVERDAARGRGSRGAGVSDRQLLAADRAGRLRATVASRSCRLAKPRRGPVELVVVDAGVPQVSAHASVATLELREDAAHRLGRRAADPAYPLTLFLR